MTYNLLKTKEKKYPIKTTTYNLLNYKEKKIQLNQTLT